MSTLCNQCNILERVKSNTKCYKCLGRKQCANGCERSAYRHNVPICEVCVRKKQNDNKDHKICKQCNENTPMANGLCQTCLGYKKLCIVCNKNQQKRDNKCNACHPDGAPKCVVCNKRTIVRNKMCVRCGGDEARIYCKFDGCTSVPSGSGGGYCREHGGVRKLCSTCNIRYPQENGLCVSCGAEIKKCSVCGDTNIRGISGLCYKHGGEKQLCKNEKCPFPARTGGYCTTHGGTRPQCIKCIEEGGYANYAVRRGVCIKHGAIIQKCKICEYFHGETRYTQNDEKVFMCASCFYHAYPDEPRSIRYTTHQHYINNELKKTYGDKFFVYDSIINGGCSKYRPDWFKDCLTHSIIIECDENQHKYYEEDCEQSRLENIYGDLACRPLVVIRFNPDDYVKNDTVIESCFGHNGRLTNKENFDIRYNLLVSIINKHLEEIPQKDLIIEKICYDECD